MVSKNTKRTPTKSLKDCRRARRKKTPVKASSSSSSVVLESLFTCRRRLVKIFSNLLKISPKRMSPRKQDGYVKLKNWHSTVVDVDKYNRFEMPDLKLSKPLFLGLPPLANKAFKTVFLDLDETLIHSTLDVAPHTYDFVVTPVIDGQLMNFYVSKRPFLDHFLHFLHGKFEVVVFTAGLRDYASLVLDVLDTNRVIHHRLYRDSCRQIDGKFVKDLSQMGRDLWKVVIVDDNPNSYAFQPENAIQIKPFVDDFQDNELQKLIHFFEACVDDEVKDIRDVVNSFVTQENHE
ncbi:hypothetical protein vseg_007339 [Gypsophila vaccaria]